MQKITPKSLGYYFPAEWERHKATWLTYPQNQESWPDNYEFACREFNNFVKAISRSEHVHINVNDLRTKYNVTEDLDKIGCAMENLFLHIIRSDDCWCRDHGPVFLLNSNGNLGLVDSEFNAWGKKYPSENDNRISSEIAEITGYECFKPGIVMEGGSIEVNGKGTILTTKACLLNKNRNPQLSHTKIEEYLREYYCADQILWFDDGIAGDDTDGHIDDIARFTDHKTILLAIDENKKSPNYKVLQNNLRAAGKFSLPDGSQPEIIEIPIPTLHLKDGTPLPASYANYYVCNSGVIVPIFGCSQDQKALDILSKAFPNKEIIALSSSDIIYGLGSWHCLSQQEPLAQNNL